MNLLSKESSPYLLQHANNPVHWQPWSDAALAEAKATGKPILVSIGYSACHWCHVMEKESFENEATAAVMNEHFVCIKIDREERPDLDHIYMDAVQAMTGSGGWPLNVFLTPDAKPFYGGTYFPPVKAFNRASWTDVLHAVHDAWTNRRNEMEAQADNLIAHIESSGAFSAGNDPELIAGTKLFSLDDVASIAGNLLANADKTEGGFGKAPKFPQTFSITALMQSAHFLQDADALKHAELSLQKMYRGGIYDQLAGGLCRYSTDGEWLVPHFEKMLYDNALFLSVLSDALLLTKKNIYREAIIDTCDFLIAEMKDAGGGFYSALDADSEGEEGKFYIWTAAEIDAILKEDAALFKKYFSVEETGNFSSHEPYHAGQNILHVADGFMHDAADRKAIEEAKTKLRAVRAERVRPGTDDKILLGWNAMLVKAFAKVFASTGIDRFKAEAVELMEFIIKNFSDKEGRYYHTYKKGSAKYPAFLDDLANLADAAVHLQEITGIERYLYLAKEITEHTISAFSDDEGILFFYTASHQRDVPVRKVEMYDGATPSGNAIMALNLLRLGLFFHLPHYSERAQSMLVRVKAAALKYPSSFGVWAEAIILSGMGINEIMITGEAPQALLNEVLNIYIPNKVLQTAEAPSQMPLAEGKSIDKNSVIYLCKDYACSSPVNTAAELALRVTPHPI